MRDERELYGARCFAAYVMVENVWRCMEKGREKVQAI